MSGADHDTAAEYTLAIAAVREIKVRAGEIPPNPERPDELRWAAEGSVPVRDLETGIARGETRDARPGSEAAA